jgi:hypothetical protein
LLPRDYEDRTVFGAAQRKRFASSISEGYADSALKALVDGFLLVRNGREMAAFDLRRR